MGSSTTQPSTTRLSQCCDNPSKWGLQQPRWRLGTSMERCNNPSKWGLQQLFVNKQVKEARCDNPSKWGLQQLQTLKVIHLVCCDNPSKWGLQQQIPKKHFGTSVVITPQNGVFNNATCAYM